MPDDQPKSLDSINNEGNEGQSQPTPPPPPKPPTTPKPETQNEQSSDENPSLSTPPSPPTPPKPSSPPPPPRKTEASPKTSSAPSGSQPAPSPSSGSSATPTPSTSSPSSGAPSSQPSTPPPPPSPAQQKVSAPPPPPPGADATPQEQAEGTPPPPSGPEVAVRTMDSDTQSLRETGGEMARPEVVKLGEETNSKKPESKEGSDQQEEEELNIPGYGGSEESMFTPSKKTQEKDAGDDEKKKPRGKKKKLVLLIGGLIFFAGLGALTYFVVLPLILGPQEVATPEPTPTPEPTTTATPTPTPTPEPSFVHKSLFVSTPETVREYTLPSIQLSSVMNTVRAVSQVLENESLAEITLKKESGVPLSFQEFMSALYPSFTESELGIFNQDFTFFVYKKDGVSFPGYLARLENPGNVAAARQLMQKFEAPDFPYLSSIYPNDPGNSDVAGFKDGMANDLTTRYITFETPNAALNYGISDDGLLAVSGSYFGLLSALDHLQAPEPTPAEESMGEETMEDTNTSTTTTP